MELRLVDQSTKHTISVDHPQSIRSPGRAVPVSKRPVDSVEELDSSPRSPPAQSTTPAESRSWPTRIADRIQGYVVPRTIEARNAHLLSGIAWFLGSCYFASPAGLVALVLAWIVFPVLVDKLKS